MLFFVIYTPSFLKNKVLQTQQKPLRSHDRSLGATVSNFLALCKACFHICIKENSVELSERRISASICALTIIISIFPCCFALWECKTWTHSTTVICSMSPSCGQTAALHNLCSRTLSVWQLPKHLHSWQLQRVSTWLSFASDGDLHAPWTPVKNYLFKYLLCFAAE